ncbi:DUF885 domain-containing protein [Ferrimonas senticii]|uniref:DUF885 domain-containing protein n=1 Tax=Ferrimonas senticii TaxID=394566 RepID=UPI00041E65B8|nr:DUF885 domain-containing protein [Ferrimonas senticii]
MKKLLKIVGGSLLTVTVAAGGFAAHEWYADKPVFLRSLLDRELIKVGMQSPETLTSLGFLESLGIKGHNAELDDASPESADKLYQQIRDLKYSLSLYDNLPVDQQLSADVTNYLLDYALETEALRYHNYPVNQLFGLQNGYPTFMDAQHLVTDAEDADNYNARLQAVKTKFTQALQGLTLREQKGIIPPRFVIDRVLDEMTAFVATPASDNILYTSLATKLADTELTEAEQQQQLATAASNIEQWVYPAYQLLIDYFTELAPKAGNDDGFWHLPNGEAAYAASLKLFTTTDYTPDQIHQLGLSEVARLQAEMMQILAAEGIDIEPGFTAAMAELAADPKHYYPDTDEGRAQILADYQAIIDEIDAGIDSAFNIRPKATVEVLRIPEFKEKTAPGAYYQQPALDGSRPGRFYANLWDIKATPKYGMRTLAYHEAVPGHHFQVAISMELEGLPFIRKMSPFTAYVEGWALYAEQVAWEMGFQSEPLDNLGRLGGELFRAVRLVVDTGIHHKRWTREQAIEYMAANTGMAQSDVVSEIERYIVMPGQATAYKVGMIKILELRERSQQALGDDFDLAEFHDVILKDGALPLSLLERNVERYIAGKNQLAAKS